MLVKCIGRADLKIYLKNGFAACWQAYEILGAHHDLAEFKTVWYVEKCE